MAAAWAQQPWQLQNEAVPGRLPSRDLGLALHHRGLLQMVGARSSCEQHADNTCSPIT